MPRPKKERNPGDGHHLKRLKLAEKSTLLAKPDKWIASKPERKPKTAKSGGVHV